MLDGAGRKAGLRPRILIPDLVERAGLGSRVLLERAGLVSDRGLEGSRLLRTAIGLDGLGSRSTAESTSGVRRGNTFRNGCEGAPSGRDTVGRRGVLAGRWQSKLSCPSVQINIKPNSGMLDFQYSRDCFSGKLCTMRLNPIIKKSCYKRINIT